MSVTAPVAAVDADAAPISVRDPFGLRAPKLGCLFGLSSAASALFVGQDESWATDLAAHFQRIVHVRTRRELERIVRAGQRFDIVVAASVGGQRDSGVDCDAWCIATRDIELLRRSVDDGGSALVFGQNRFAVRSGARDPMRFTRSGLTTARSCHAELVRAGFQRIDDFVPLPNLRDCEELVSVSAPVALPSSASSVERAFNRLGLLPLIHDGSVHVAAVSANGGPARLLGAFEDHLRQFGRELGSLRLERFDLRERGALVVMMRAVSGDGVVGRIAAESRVDARIRRNAEWTSRIHAHDVVSQLTKRHVPRPLGAFDWVDGATAYAEELVSGTLAWKVVRNPRIERAVLVDSIDFLRRLGSETGAVRTIGATLANTLFPKQEYSWLPSRTSSTVASLRDALVRRSLGSARTIVITHGDFGYGNTIVDARSGRLRGVIDWDQAREDIRGVDVMNLMIARDRTPRPLDQKFRAIGQAVVDGHWDQVATVIDFESALPMNCDERTELVALAAFRWVERALCYPSLFMHDHDLMYSLARWARSLLG